MKFTTVDMLQNNVALVADSPSAAQKQYAQSQTSKQLTDKKQSRNKDRSIKTRN